MAQNEPNQTKRAHPIRNLGIVLLIFAFQGLAQAEDIRWHSFETEHAIIQYQNVNDLRKFHCKITRGGLRNLFSAPKRDVLLGEVRQEVDILFKRVQETLGIQRKAERVNIRLYPNKEQLDEAYEQIYGKPCRVQAWYRWRDKTVYVNVRDLHRGMLCHELCHHMLNNFFIMQVPTPIAEAVGRFVEREVD